MLKYIFFNSISTNETKQIRNSLYHINIHFIKVLSHSSDQAFTLCQDRRRQNRTRHIEYKFHDFISVAYQFLARLRNLNFSNYTFFIFVKMCTHHHTETTTEPKCLRKYLKVSLGPIRKKEFRKFVV